MSNFVFMFMLTPAREEPLHFHVMERMKREFPQHDFIVAGADLPEFQNTIFPIRDAVEAFAPGTKKVADRLEVLAVTDAFRRVLDELRDWKLS